MATNSDLDNDDEIAEVDHGFVTKIENPIHLAAYLEERELQRDVSELQCDKRVLETVVTNYILMKQILRPLPWQEKMLCKVVCSTWYSAVQALQRELLYPQDFIFSLEKSKAIFKQSGNFHVEPMLVLTIVNSLGYLTSSKCTAMVPRPCLEECEHCHSLIDAVQQITAFPKDCMWTNKANYVSYFPLKSSPTQDYTISYNLILAEQPFIGGIYIPKLPNVNFQTINIKREANMTKDFHDVINEITATQTIKGILVFVTENCLLNIVQEMVFLNYFKVIQPDTPFALAGCIIEDTFSQQMDIAEIINGMNNAREYISASVVAIGLFTVPKNITNVECNNFSTYSLVIERSDWTRMAIQKVIKEFASKIPKFQHSVAIKLTCVGRDQKHDIEQNYFRESFPNTRIIGCYGNGELGINYPEKTREKVQSSTAKRQKIGDGANNFMYSYSTVFFFIGWGKISSPT